MRVHHTRKPLDLGCNGTSRHEEIARRQYGLAHCRNCVGHGGGEHPQPDGDVPDAQTCNTSLIHEPREALGRRLANREPALGYTRPFGGKWIENLSAPGRGDGRETPGNETVSAPCHYSSPEPER